jgi:hypothetical protein
MPDGEVVTPLEFVTVEPAGYCDPETGVCVIPSDEDSPEPVTTVTAAARDELRQR